MPDLEEKKKIIELLMKNNILISPEILNALNSDENIRKILALREITEESLNSLIFQRVKSKVKVIKSYKEEAKKRSVEDFTAHFNTRYGGIKEIIQKKQEMQDTISIKRVIDKNEKENVSIIGMIYEKAVTKNNNIIFTLEDPTGQINVVVNKNRPELFSIARDCVCDEIIGVVGTSGNKAIFANNIILPEIPATNELKKSPVEEYAIFTGDQHVGASQFLHDKFDKFLAWLNGTAGSEEQRQMAQKARYLFLVGDLVDGVGIHPLQYNELEIKDIKAQYSILAEKLKQIPDRIEIIMCAGNHDALRLIEPQPPLYTDYAEKLYELPNAHILSNPSIVNIGATGNFRGFNVLLYHGFSFNFYAEAVESISVAGGAKRADLIMKFLLQRRHLAPEHASVTSSPRTEEDPLLIDIIPDFFVTGHIHRSTVSSYRNITMLNCSCWIDMTSFQEKVGLVPEPARVVAVNLQTREAKVIKF